MQTHAKNSQPKLVYKSPKPTQSLMVTCRDSGNDFFVSEISDGSVTFLGTQICCVF